MPRPKPLPRQPRKQPFAIHALLTAPLYAALEAEAQEQGVSMAAIVRWALRDRYERAAAAAS